MIHIPISGSDNLEEPGIFGGVPLGGRDAGLQYTQLFGDGI